MLNKIYAIVFTGLLTACAGSSGTSDSGVIEKAYPGPERPASELALIIGTERDGYGLARIAKIDGKIYGDDMLGGDWPRRLYVLPGTHQVTSKCNFGRSFAFPAVEAEFEAGKTYELVCKVNEDRSTSIVIFTKTET